MVHDIYISLSFPQSAVVWFDMIEYYESTCHLNISFNKNIGVRGWQACSRLIRRVSENVFMMYIEQFLQAAAYAFTYLNRVTCQTLPNKFWY